MAVIHFEKHFSNQLSRHALLYLLSSFVACNALLLAFLPWWLFLVAAGCFVWRGLIFTGRASFPARILRVILVLISGTALFAQYRFSLSIDLFVTLLLLGFSLKLLELYQKQDAQLLLYLSLFVLMTVFLFAQTVGYAVLVFLAVIVVLSALIAIQSDEAVLQDAAWHPLRRGAWVFAAALPVMLFLFVVMPRLPPLWSMPLQTKQAKTGMSDSMGFGDVADLAKSSDIAFRASFTNGVPSRESLYWYGLFLDQFDGLRWSESCKYCLQPTTDVQEKNGKPYQVVLEASGQPWIYFLWPSAINSSLMRVKPDGMVRYVKNVTERRIYYADFLSTGAMQPLSAAGRAHYLALPTVGNEKATQLAAQWKKQSSNADEIVRHALDFYRASFHYTLQPPLLNNDRIDDFLFNTRKGFCEHFAGSFVFLMRAAGIPARVAVGYMGGEVDEGSGFVVVRQYDAHAWAEVWLEGSGWRRVDPTAAVAPERIDMSVADAYASQARFTSGADGFLLRQFSLLNRMRLELDRFDYVWSRWVLSYSEERQLAFLQKLGLLSPWRIAAWGAGIVALAFMALCIFLYWRERGDVKEHPATRHYRSLCNAYARLGIAREISETPLHFAERVSAAGVRHAEQFLVLSKEYHAWLYQAELNSGALPSPKFMVECRRLAWRLRWEFGQ